jgi:phospholipid/cholesterol/gamma-HCH transport system ATP-binding protein
VVKDALIRAEDLTLGYPGLTLFEEETFTIGRGEVFAIMGDSGSGKSTLLRAILGLVSPLSGRLEIVGRGAPSLEPGRPDLGVSFQSDALFGSMSIRDNLRLPLTAWTDLPDEVVDRLVYSKLALVGVEGVIDRYPDAISGGQSKRVAIARSLMLDPDIILLDEPFAGLDPVNARGVETLVSRLNEALGITVVMVSHMVDRVRRIADRCLLVAAAERAIVALGDPRELREAPPNSATAAFFERGEERAA